MAGGTQAQILEPFKKQLDWESIRSSPRDGLSTSYRLTKGFWGFRDFGFRGLGLDNYVLAEDSGLLQVLPLTVHLTTGLDNRKESYSCKHLCLAQQLTK